MKRILRRIVSLFTSARAEDELAREMTSHLALIEDEHMRRGLTRDEARIAARRAMGSVALAKDLHRDARSFVWFDDAHRDLSYAVRTFLRRPGFALAVVVTVALGIGASTAIFSVVYGVSLRPLPYLQPDRLVRIYEANPASGELKQDVSDGAFHAWREGAPSIEAAALYSKRGTRFLAGSREQPATTMSVSPAFFDVLGVHPLLGSGFKPEREYTRSTADDDAILSFAAWQRLLGGRPDVIGQRLEFSGAGDNDVYQIVGVMPEGFAFGEPVDLWRPTNIIELPIARVVRNWRYDRVIARLGPGATIEGLRSELEVVSGRLAREFPESSGGWTVTVESLHDSVIGNFGRGSWLLLAAVAVVLLVTCVNVGSLLVARAVARERETATRAALGAGAWRLLRLRLAEAAVLGVTGGAFGVLLAWYGVATLKAAAPPGIPRLDAIAIDERTLIVAAFCTAVALASFTAASLFVGRRRELIDRLRATSVHGGESRTHRSTRRVLIAVQSAGAVALIVLAAMLTRSFLNLIAFDLGWDARGVLSLRVLPPIPPQLRLPWYRYVEWSDFLVARLEATPGIDRAAITTQIPLAPDPFPSTLAKGRGRVAPDEGRWSGIVHNVTDGYFETMGVRVLDGRTFGRVDRFNEAQVTSVQRAEHGTVIVSRTTARLLWPDRPALGQALWLPDIDNVSWREVVGVVEDIQFHGVGEPPALHVFVPWTQRTTGSPRLVVKGDGDLAAVVRRVVEEVEPGTHLDQIEPLTALVARATAQHRFVSRTVALFGTLSLLLAAVGIYGTLSYLVGAQTREIGVRLALGAPRMTVLSTMALSAVAPAAAGIVAGLPVAWMLARMAPALLFDVGPFDLWSSMSGAAILLLAVCVAALAPARRATGVDPLVALRSE
jgi:putative ABC transport system permease protein